VSAIQQLPDNKDWGLEFNYSVWTANTVVTLCNVPWNSDYRDIVRFDNQAALDAFIDNSPSPKVIIDKMSYAKVGMPIRINIPFNAAYKYNYVRAHNPMSPIAGDEARSFYYFIQDVVYVNPTTTQLFVQLDVWQTFGYGISFGNCYVEQGHIGIANESQFSNYGKDYLTVPEGMDIGNEYAIEKMLSYSVASARQFSLGMPDYSIMVTSSTSLDADPGTVDNPNLVSATGSSMENLPNGADIYLFNSLGHLREFLVAFANKPWVTQGIMSIQAVPRMARYGVSLTTKTIEGIPVDEVNEGTLHNIKSSHGNWREAVAENFNPRYAHLKKFFTFPYMVLELTSYTGMPLMLKPECWQDDNATVVEVPHFAPPNARLSFYPYRYNTTSRSPAYEDDDGVVHDGGEFLNMTTGISNFPTFSVVNNGYMQFMASNANSIAYQHSSASWSQQKALAGNSNTYDQSTSSMNTSADLTNIGIDSAKSNTNLANQMSGARAIQNGINAVGRIGDSPTGIVGAATSMANTGITYAMDVHQANESMAISTGQMANSTNRSNQHNTFVRDTNKNLSDWSANGDYQNQIAGIQARTQDAQLTQPTTSGQVGGDAFLLANYRWGYDIRVKLPQSGVITRIGEYWLRYGYAINMFTKMPETFMVMEKFTYWKIKESYITGAACPEQFKQAIRGIFEKGVTVWKNPSDIGNIDIGDNAPLPGVGINIG